MFRLGIREVPEEYVADLVGNIGVEFLVGKKPIGTCDNMSVDNVSIAIGDSHPVGPVGECLDDQLLILLSPFAHPRVRVDDRRNILDDVLLLPSFIVKGHLKRRQGLESSSDINFWSTCETYMNIWEGKFDKLLHEIQDQFPWGWQPKGVGTLVERIHNNVDWAVILKCECFLQVSYQHVIIGLMCAMS